MTFYVSVISALVIVALAIFVNQFADRFDEEINSCGLGTYKEGACQCIHPYVGTHCETVDCGYGRLINSLFESSLITTPNTDSDIGCACESKFWAIRALIVPHGTPPTVLVPAWTITTELVVILSARRAQRVMRWVMPTSKRGEHLIFTPRVTASAYTMAVSGVILEGLARIASSSAWTVSMVAVISMMAAAIVSLAIMGIYVT